MNTAAIDWGPAEVTEEAQNAQGGVRAQVTHIML